MSIPISQLYSGMTIIADVGSTCVRGGQPIVIHSDDMGNLYVNCLRGRHFLTGVVAGIEYITGFHLPTERS